jgi:protein tyrosine phosphatase (PTP) superfamily phosphohydrolase (DUF442 family)
MGFHLGCAGSAAVTPSLKNQAAIPSVVLPATLSPQMPRDNYVPGVENFGFISADVWRGAKPTLTGAAVLASMGVRTIIDLRAEGDADELPPGMRYIRLPVSSWHADRVDIKALLKAIDTNPKPVFIHCLEGRDRTGLAVAAYRLTQGMSADNALQEMKNFRVNFWWCQPITNRVRELAKSVGKRPDSKPPDDR